MMVVCICWCASPVGARNLFGEACAPISTSPLKVGDRSRVFFTFCARLPVHSVDYTCLRASVSHSRWDQLARDYLSILPIPL